MKQNQEHRYFGINFQNIGTRKNTIEFRLPNGTIDADTWIENINLFGGIVKAAEELARIEEKPEEKRAKEEQEKLECLKKIKNKDISQEEKLEALLGIVIPEEERYIYKERYKVNSELLEDKPDIRYAIVGNISKKPLNIKKIGKYVFVGEDAITGEDYRRGSTIIENDLGKENPDRIPE